MPIESIENVNPIDINSIHNTFIKEICKEWSSPHFHASKNNLRSDIIRRTILLW